jgi:hypothetical protein
MTSPQPEQQPTTGKIARDAAVHEAVSFGVYAALVLGFSVAIAKRDALARAQARARLALFPRPASSHEREVAGLRADVSRLEHDPDAWGPPC